MKPLLILTIFALWFWYARPSAEVRSAEHLRKGRELVKESEKLERDMKALPIMQLSTEEFIIAVERLAKRGK